MFSQASVILSKGGECHNPPPPPEPQKGAVRIPLECYLVCPVFMQTFILILPVNPTRNRPKKKSKLTDGGRRLYLCSIQQGVGGTPVSLNGAPKERKYNG